MSGFMRNRQGYGFMAGFMETRQRQGSMAGFKGRNTVKGPWQGIWRKGRVYGEEAGLMVLWRAKGIKVVSGVQIGFRGKDSLSSWQEFREERKCFIGLF